MTLDNPPASQGQASTHVVVSFTASLPSIQPPAQLALDGDREESFNHFTSRWDWFAVLCRLEREGGVPESTSIHGKPPVFTRSLPYFCFDFGAKTAITGFLMFSCGFFVRACRAELKYGKTLAVGAGVLSYGFSKFRKTESPVFLVLQLVMYGQ